MATALRHATGRNCMGWPVIEAQTWIRFSDPGRTAISAHFRFRGGKSLLTQVESGQ
jgi:hypothetical protein